jgi:hypothetical protein
LISSAPNTPHSFSPNNIKDFFMPSLFSDKVVSAISGESKPHVDSIRQSILSHAGHLSANDVEKIVSGLMSDRLARDNGELHAAAEPQPRYELKSPIQAAADVRNHALLKNVAARLRRLGFNLDLASNKQVDKFALDTALRASADVEERIAVKSMLFQLGMIPA